MRRAGLLEVTLVCAIGAGGLPGAQQAWAQQGGAEPRAPETALRDMRAQAGSVIAALGVTPEAHETRLNRCGPPRAGQERDDVYTVWIGIRAHLSEGGAATTLSALRDSWADAGWTLTRDRTLDNGGRNIAATDPATGAQYSLDSGFDADPDGYIVGFFNSPCFTNPAGAVAFGPVSPRL